MQAQRHVLKRGRLEGDRKTYNIRGRNEDEGESLEEGKSTEKKPQQEETERKVTQPRGKTRTQEDVKGRLPHQGDKLEH